MLYFLLLLIPVIIVTWISFSANSKNDKFFPTEEDKMENIVESQRNKIIEVLKKMGCQPETDENGNINVAYQGETFVLVPRGHFLSIWDPYWSSIQVHSPDYDDLIASINISNFDFAPTVVYTKPDEKARIFFIKREIISCVKT